MRALHLVCCVDSAINAKLSFQIRFHLGKEADAMPEGFHYMMIRQSIQGSDVSHTTLPY